MILVPLSWACDGRAHTYRDGNGRSGLYNGAIGSWVGKNLFRTGIHSSRSMKAWILRFAGLGGLALIPVLYYYTLE
jgi:hypothetical protein